MKKGIREWLIVTIALISIEGGNSQSSKRDDWPLDYLHYYASGLYSKWETEEEVNNIQIGVKHKYGKKATWNNRECWSSEGIIGARDSLVYGPHYSQEKQYKRAYQSIGWYNQAVEYNVRFRMALKINGFVSKSDTVCRIKVVHSYSKEKEQCSYEKVDTTLLQRTLTVADFNQEGSFKYIGFSELYEYDSRFFPLKKAMGEPADYCPPYLDNLAGDGIEFCVDWLRDDTLCTLYIDYVEVYDNDGWNNFLTDEANVLERLHYYVEKYCDWKSIVYWCRENEPYAIDAIEPMKRIGEIVRNVWGDKLTAYKNNISPAELTNEHVLP